MKDKDISILTALKSLKKPNPEQKYIDEIIEISFKIAYAYLKDIHNQVNVDLSIDGSKLEDIAIESIQHLLFMNEDGYLFAFNNAINKNQSFLQSEEDAIYFLNKIVSQQVENRISRLLKENDLSFARILNWVELLAKREGYKKINYFGNNYLVENDAKQISGIVLNENDFNILPIELFNNKDEVLRDILNYLKNEDKFFPAIPINILVQHLKILFVKDNTLEKNLKEVSETINSNFQNKNNFKVGESKNKKSNFIKDE